MAWGIGVAAPKPEPHKRTKARRDRDDTKRIKAVRVAVFDRDDGRCRCCRIRVADSMHEIRPRSLGGRVCLENSIALCGSGTTGCHGLCQSHRVLSLGRDANHALTFQAATQAAKDWIAGR